MPENVETVTSIQQLLKLAAHKHATALKKSSLRRILQIYLKFHPYKIILATKLSETDYANPYTVCAEILELGKETAGNRHHSTSTNSESEEELPRTSSAMC
ncbi:hypothetical protein NPIL_164421 [Nephila pilipes]|uniref:Uncharacterized protein n=1 Tax=Nephila pilipes TaxID=299642 RepID=A0A8X6UDD6_NEPPI|nr:hypothetical protein NPIL_164421 [Nephila pilipes]